MADLSSGAAAAGSSDATGTSDAAGTGIADRSDTAARLAVAVGRINRRIRPASDGLSHGLLSALSTIVRTGPLRPGNLARCEVVAAPTMARALADLESRGLVTRSPDPADGRFWFIEATDAGAEAVLRARAERAARVELLLAELDVTQIERIAGALDALEATTTAAGPPPTH